MFEGLVSQLDTMTLWEELHTICFTVFIVGGTICCGVRCLRPESGLNEVEPLSADLMPRAPALSAKEKPVQVARRRDAAATPLPSRRRRLLAAHPETRVPPHVCRRAGASWGMRSHALH